jgi:hypothetical protein
MSGHAFSMGGLVLEVVVAVGEYAAADPATDLGGRIYEQRNGMSRE